MRGYEIYAIANGINDKDERIQCSVLLHVAGPDSQKLVSTWDIPKEEKDKINPGWGAWVAEFTNQIRRFETQAAGAVTAQLGGTVLFSGVTCTDEPRGAG